MNVIEESEQFGDHSPPPLPNNNGHGRISTVAREGTGFRLAVAAVVVFLVLGISFAIAYFVRSSKEADAQQISTTTTDAVPSVDVVTVRSTASTYPLVLPGQTAGWFESTIYARVDGYVDKWSGDIGDRVKAGQVLATIETPELDQQLGAAQARANAAIAQVKVAAANESIAKITYERWWESPKGVVSEQERQEKKSTYESATAQLEAAKAQHQLDEADVNRLKALEAFKQVTAPYEGVITGRHVDIGDLVTAGSSSGTTSLYTIAQANVIRTFVDVPQKLASQMAVGLDANATSDQFPGRVFHGKVARSTRSIDPQSRTQKTEIDIPNKDLVLLPGMYVQVNFEVKQRGLLQVPAASILFKPKGLQVAVIDEDDKVLFRPITIAKDNGDTVELETGVKQNERVALNISNYIAAGDKVTPINVDKELGTTEPPPLPMAPPASDTENKEPVMPKSPSGDTPTRDPEVNPPPTAAAGPVQANEPPIVADPTTAPSAQEH